MYTGAVRKIEFSVLHEEIDGVELSITLDGNKYFNSEQISPPIGL